MPLYRVYAKLVVQFESDKPLSQIEGVFNGGSPTLKEALKQAWRDMLAQDPSGNTHATEWHYHVGGHRESDGLALALDNGTVREVER